ncbi:MAG: hypothetical protein ACYDEY_13820 [Acidimicrobiales bacterium]
MGSNERLTSLEFMGLMAGIVPLQAATTTLRLRHSDAPQQLATQHSESTGSTPAETVADLIISILKVKPYEYSLSDKLPNPNLLLCIAATHAYLEKVGRALHLGLDSERAAPTQLELDVISILEEAANDRNLARGQLVSRLNPLLPADEWPAPAPTTILAGVSASVAYAVSGVHEDELKKTRLIADGVKRELESLGFSVRTCTEHPVGQDCSSDCEVTRDVDLLVVIYPRPSTRVGHQVKGVSDLLGLTLVLVPRSVSELTCLFKSKELGHFTVCRYGGATDARREIKKFANENARLLNAHAVHRVTRDDWHRASFLELRERVVKRMSVQGQAAGPGLVTKFHARHLVSSIAIYGEASIAMINTVRNLVDLPPLGGYADSLYDGLFSLEQIFELDQLVASGDIGESDRSELVAQAAKGLVSAGRNVDRRSRSFLVPDDWLGEYVALLASRRTR